MWWGSEARDEHCRLIHRIPYWKRVYYCLSSPRKWREAAALNKAAAHALMEVGDDALFDRLVQHSDKLWREIFHLCPTKFS